MRKKNMTIKVIMETIEKLENLKVEAMAEYIQAKNWRMRKNWFDLKFNLDRLIDRYKSLDVTDESYDNIKNIYHLLTIEMNLFGEFVDLKEKSELEKNFNCEGIIIKTIPRVIDIEKLFSKEDIDILKKKLL